MSAIKILAALVIVGAWTALVIVGLIRGKVEGVTETMPVVLLAAGYLFGSEIAGKARETLNQQRGPDA